MSRIKKPVNQYNGTESCHICYEIFNSSDQIDNNDDIAQYICPDHTSSILEYNGPCNYYGYFKDGNFHRSSGPARIWTDLSGNIIFKEYWTHGKYNGNLSPEEQIIKDLIE